MIVFYSRQVIVCIFFRDRLEREEAIGLLVDSFSDDPLFVSTTGMISRELFEYR